MSDSSTEKVVALLDAFKEAKSLHGVTELAARAGLTKSTTHRILGALMRSGCVGRMDSRYFLTPHLFEIGSYTILSRPRGLRDLAMPYMSELFAETRQVIHLAVLDGDILHVERIQGVSKFRCTTTVGTRRPAHATALGKALLAFSPEHIVEPTLSGPLPQLTPRTLSTRTQLEQALARTANEGFATDFEEGAVSQSCLAVPILGMEGHAVAAISICCPRLNWRWSTSLRKLGDQLSREIARKPIGPPRPMPETLPPLHVVADDEVPDLAFGESAAVEVAI